MATATEHAAIAQEKLLAAPRRQRKALKPAVERWDATLRRLRGAYDPNTTLRHHR